MSANSNEKITKLNNINKQINQHDLAITEKRIPLVLQEFKNFINFYLQKISKVLLIIYHLILKV